MSNDTPFSSALRSSIFRELDRNLSAPTAAESARALVAIRAAMRKGALNIALRTVDRAWRLLSADDAVFAPIYGRLLCLEAKDSQAALQLLRCAADFSPDPDIAALIVVSLLRLQRFEDARRQFETALSDYCIEEGSLLVRAGAKIIQHPAIGVAGWIGLGAHLQTVGQLASSHGASALDIAIDGASAFTQLLPIESGKAARIFTLNLPPGVGSAGLAVSCRGAALLGDGLLGSGGFCLDGRAHSRGRRLRGWARIGWLPAQPVNLRIEDDGGRRLEMLTGRKAKPSWHWPFRIDLDEGAFRGNQFHISAQLPDGKWQPLPDTPLLLEPAMQLAGRRPATLGHWRPGSPSPKRPHQLHRAKLVDVVIPVFRGCEETLACIQSVLATLPGNARLVIVDDASDDQELIAALDALEADGRIRLLRNAPNQGFVVSANRGLSLHPSRDVVLLNSDTLVFDDWLPRLQAAAYSGPNVGTVAPLSNSGSIASYPQAAGAPLDPQTAAALHALAASTLAGTRVELPVGVGFCLYLRRDCLREVGGLDAAAFGKGYGEETDFCLRARRKGWSHQLAADVFVYHAGGISFASRRNALLDRSQRLLNLRHPGFHEFIANFVAQNPLRAARRRLDQERVLATQHRFVLIVTLALPGGVDRFVTQRSQELRAKGLFTLLLRPAAAGDSGRCELWTDALEVPNLQYEIPSELSELISLLDALRLDSIEIQHFLDLDSQLIDAVRSLRVPYDVMIHDYSWVCPRVTFIDGTGRYCGEPAVEVCRGCVRRNGSKLGETISVPALRRRSARWLNGARRVSAPSNDTAARLRRYFSGLTVDVRPHSEAAVAPLPIRRTPRKVLRVALIGAIGTHKGYRVLLDCARDARARKLPIEYVVIGHTELDAPLLATRKVFITGRYSEAEGPHLIQREEPDVALLPSVWPETWCYTLDLALGAGLPVVAFDLGAIAERLRSAQHGVLLPLALEAPQINDRLLALGERMRHSNLTESIFFPAAMPHARDDAKMHGNKAVRTHMMKSANGPKTANGFKPVHGPKSANGFKSGDVKLANGLKMAKVQPAEETHDVHQEIQDGLSASVQVLPLPAGLYLFSVKAAAPSSSNAGGQLALPAMHVGLGPGVRSEQVEFIAGPSTHGAWLFSAGDLLVTKISGAGVTLILTSVRAPRGEVLSISVERLDTRADVKFPAATSKTPPPTAPKREPKSVVQVPDKSVFKPTDPKLPLPVEIGAHIRTRGDMTFANVPWAGRVAPGLWIESFSVRPLEYFGEKDLEYKGLTGSGFETPWLSEGKMCGTKGMATPLVGFAIRLKPSPAAAGYDCEYSGYFQSGKIIGPLRNGAPCRSSVASDSLEGIQVRLVKRTSIVLPEATGKTADSKAVRRAADPAPATAKRSLPSPNRSTDGVVLPARREPTRRP